MLVLTRTHINGRAGVCRAFLVFHSSKAFYELTICSACEPLFPCGFYVYSTLTALPRFWSCSSCARVIVFEPMTILVNIRSSYLTSLPKILFRPLRFPSDILIWELGQLSALSYGRCPLCVLSPRGWAGRRLMMIFRYLAATTGWCFDGGSGRCVEQVSRKM